jgi:glycerol-3-phosphate O-acyltransferase
MPTYFSRKIRQRLSGILGGTHNHYSCFLPRRIGGISALILKLFYSGIKIDEKQTAAIRQLEEDAIVVYVSKFTNSFEFLFYYQRYRQLDLPFPQIGFGYKVYFWQPVSRILRILLAQIDFFFQNLKPLHPYNNDYLRQALLKDRAGYLSLVGKKAFYRRFIKAQKSPITYLLETQKLSQRPIYLVPQLLFFTQKPRRAHPSALDMLFGPEDNPGKIRRLIVLFKRPEKIFVEVSEPINLKDYLSAPEIRERSIEYQSLMLRRDLLLRMNRHRQSITGPIIKTREELKESMFTSDRFRQFVDEYSENRDIPIREVRKKADAYVEEIAAKYNPGVLKIYSAIVGWIIRTMFEDVIVNTETLDKVKNMSLRGPLVLLPCHKSHIDYLILSYLMYHNNMPCPLIAAGKNLSFWPLGPLFRSGGAFFIRRSFRGAILYSRVFAEYIHKLLEEGFNIEQFIEGGRSRTGKLLMPKLGLLSILLNAYKNGACEDMIIVPIYIGYDRVLEEKSYLNELEGGKKEPENLKQVIQARKFLRNRYGKIYIQFHEPLALNELLGQTPPLQEMDSRQLSALCRNLGHRVLHAIGQKTVVTPHGLVASAILNCDAENFSADSLMPIIDTYLKHLTTQNAKLADTLVYDSYPAIQKAILSYVQRKFIEPLPADKEKPPSDATYKIDTDKRPNLEYYKNNCVGFFIPAAFTALNILQLNQSRFGAADLHEGYAFLQNLFKYEFSYDSDRDIVIYVQQNLDAFMENGTLKFQPEPLNTYHLSESGPRKLKRFAIFLKPYFESYWIVLNFFMVTPANTIKSRDRLKKISDTGDQMFRRGEITRKEALNKISYQNAVEFFVSRGVRGPEHMDRIELYAEAIQRAINIL